jgi:Uncharacterized protein conserved in bacteria (DUF2272)
MRRIFPLFLVLSLGACAAAPRPTPPLTPEQGRAAWAKSIEIALGEWQRFGGQVVHLRTDAEGNEVSAIDPVRRWEDASDAYEPLIRYWAAVGEDPESFDSWQSCSSHWRRKCPWQLPWSAAFISYVMQAAGFSAYDFPPSAEHWRYLKELIKRAREPGAIFVAERIDRYAPAPGDLICKTRAGADTPPFEALVADPDRFGDSLPMHCDLVIANAGNPERPDGRIEAIGGNVMNSVSESILPTEAGYLRRGRGGKWFVILRNRFGAGAPAS